MHIFGFIGHNPKIITDASITLIRWYSSNRNGGTVQTEIAVQLEPKYSDFGDWSQKKIDRRLKGDEGLSTIRDLVEAKDSKGNDEKYYYEGSNRREGISNGEHFNLTLKVESGQVTGPDDKSFVTNLSQTHPGTNPQTGKKYDHVLPPLGYNGAVFLSPGQASDEVKLANDDYGNPRRAIIQVNRSELLKHELRENYMRTHSNQEYWPSHQNAGGYGHFTKLKYVWE